MCTAYSSLGNGEKEESENSILLLIWLHWHFSHGTPLLTHENVLGFLTNSISDEAEKAGYEHIQVKTRPSDVVLCVSRQRKPPGLQSVYTNSSIICTFVYIYILM